MILAVASNPPSGRSDRLLALGLILASACLRLAYLAWWCPLDLAPDEAHYWDWSRHLDWSYYSKGPMVAFLIRLSCECFGPLSIALTGSEMLAVRFPAVICGTLLLTSLYILALQIYQNDRLALGVVGLALTLPMISAGSTLMTIDAPFCCCWGWALVFGYRALFQRSAWSWLGAGICIALGVLSKPTMVLWPPMLGLCLLATPALRSMLFRPGFWLMTGIGALGGLPILLWNAKHDWVTLKHTQGHAGTIDQALHPLGPLNYLALQFAVLLGFWFVAWARACWDQRPSREPRLEFRYLWWMSVPIVVFFGLFSFKNGGGEPNWPIAGYLSGIVLTVGWLAKELQHPNFRYRRLATASVTGFCFLGLILTLVIHEPSLLLPHLARWGGPRLVRRLDPTCRLRGWHYLAEEVELARAKLEREDKLEPTLAGTWWIHPGELAFYMPGHPTVYTLGSALDDRHSQYDLWHPNPVAEVEAFVGRTFLVVGSDSQHLSPGFERVEQLPDIVYREQGIEVSRWSLTLCRGYRGFPPRVSVKPAQF